MTFTASSRSRALLTASAFAIAFAGAAPLHAQQAPAQEEPPIAESTPADEDPLATAAADQEIVVTGIRQTIQTSINQKRQETAIVDALSSAEIGDLPALSVGEAIQTITGATTHREKGGASEIALRGLGPFLSNSTFNGREATNGSGDRAVNFNQFPSELVNNIKIYKTQQADLVEGGVAGTIDIGTLRPLDYGRMRVQGEIKTNYSPYQDRITGSGAWGWRGTLSYVDQFEAGPLGRIGIAVGVQRNDTNNPEETLALSTTWTACEAAVVVANNNCNEYTRAEYGQNKAFYLAPNSITFRQISEVDRRDAVFGAIQWQPSDRIDINLDAQYSTRKFVESRRDLNISEGRYGLTNVTYDEAGFITRANGLSSLESTAVELSREEEYLGGGGSIEWEASDRLTLFADASYSRTIRTEIERNARLRTDQNDVFNVRQPGHTGMRIPYVYEVLPGNFAPTITIDPRFNLTNHALFWDDARMRRDENRRENEIIAGRFDASYELEGFLSSIAAGGRWSRLTYEDYDNRNEFNLNPAITEDRRINLLCRTNFPQRDFLKEARGNSISEWATFDTDCLFREYTGEVDPGNSGDLRSVANRDVKEETLAGYLMANYESVLGALPVRGNFGVRVVNTKVTSNGLRSALSVTTLPDGSVQLDEIPGTFETVTIESQSTRILPSLNAIFELQPDVLLRLAAYRAMSRPAPSALGAGRTISLDDSGDATTIEDAIDVITANGSPRLQPLMSWNGDAAIEWYPNRDSLLSATVYYKQFTGGFIPVAIDEEFVIGGQTVTVPVIQTQNSPRKSRIYGLEVTLANRFSWLPRPLDGLGGKISYNYANSNFETEDLRLGDQIDPLTGEISEGIIPPANISGFSKHVLSGQLYYQIGGLSLQGVYNYRSSYYQDFVGGGNQLRYVRANDTVDLRASFDVNENLSFRFEAVNIFDEPKVTDMPVKGSLRQYHYYGPRYFLGVRVRI